MCYLATRDERRLMEQGAPHGKMEEERSVPPPKEQFDLQLLAAAPWEAHFLVVQHSLFEHQLRRSALLSEHVQQAERMLLPGVLVRKAAYLVPEQQAQA